MPTVVLDLDGPILDGCHRHYACYADILSENGYAAIKLNEYWEMKRRRVDRRAQLAASGAECLYDVFLQKWIERIETEPYLALDLLQIGAMEKLTEWKDQGVQLVLATQRHNAKSLLRQLAEFRLAPLFEHVVACDHAEGGGGKARRVQEVLHKCGANRLLWVGDTEVDVEAARKLGCPIWTVSCGLRSEAYLLSLAPDFISGSLMEVELGEVPG